MTSQDFQILYASIGGFLLLFGTAFAWLFKHIEHVQTAAALENAHAREALRQRMEEEICILRAKLDATDLQLNRVRDINQICFRRIYQLEYLIHQQPGIEIPYMDGWPPE